MHGRFGCYLLFIAAFLVLFDYSGGCGFCLCCGGCGFHTAGGRAPCAGWRGAGSGKVAFSCGKISLPLSFCSSFRHLQYRFFRSSYHFLDRSVRWCIIGCIMFRIIFVVMFLFIWGPVSMFAVLPDSAAHYSVSKNNTNQPGSSVPRRQWEL